MESRIYEDERIEADVREAGSNKAAATTKIISTLILLKT